MLPSPSDLKYFIEVSGTLNVSRAAERLGVSQPTLSLSIQRLEHALGTRLLIRSKTGVKLTHAGDRFVSRARALANTWERLRGDTLKDEAEIRGRYVIGAHPSVALNAFPSFLPSLLLEHSGLELKLVHDLSRRVTEDVISFKVDFGIVVNPFKHPDLVIKEFARDEVTLWTHHKPTPLQDLSSGKAILIFDPDLIQTQAILKKLEKKKMSFERTLTSSNLEVIARLVSEGVGVGVLPGRVARRSFGIKPIGKIAPIFTDSHALVYRADAQGSKASKVLAKRLFELLLSSKDPSNLM